MSSGATASSSERSFARRTFISATVEPTAATARAYEMVRRKISSTSISRCFTTA